jgi:hypothetical protein
LSQPFFPILIIHRSCGGGRHGRREARPAKDVTGMAASVLALAGGAPGGAARAHRRREVGSKEREVRLCLPKMCQLVSSEERGALAGGAPGGASPVRSRSPEGPLLCARWRGRSRALMPPGRFRVTALAVVACGRRARRRTARSPSGNGRTRGEGSRFSVRTSAEELRFIHANTKPTDRGAMCWGNQNGV